MLNSFDPLTPRILMYTFPDFRCPAEAMGLVAIVYSLIPIWVALGRGKWWIRALVGVAAIGLLLPLQAYQPAIVFSAAGLVSVLILSLLRFFAPGHQVHRQKSRPAPMIWRRVDVWMGCVLGLFTGMGLLSWAMRTFHGMGWLESALIIVPVFSTCLLVALKFGDRFRMGRILVRPFESAERSFKLIDAMIAIVLLAVLFAIDAYAIQKAPVSHWQSLLMAAALLSASSVGTAGVFTATRLQWRMVSFAVLAVVLGLSLQTSPAAGDWLMQASALAFVPTSPWGKMFGLYAAGMMMTTFCVASTGVFQFRDVDSSDESSTRRVAIGCSLVLALLFLACLVPIGVDMIQPLPPADVIAEDDSLYRQLESELAPLVNLNPKQQTLEQLRIAGKQEAASLVAAIYASVHEQAQQSFRAPDPMSAEIRFLELGQKLEVFRGWARCMDQEAKAAKQSGQFDEVCRCWLDCLRLGQGLSRGSEASYTLTGVAIEGIGHEGLVRVRKEIPIELVETLLVDLIEIDRRRESWDSIRRRCELMAEKEMSWQFRLARCASDCLSAQDNSRAQTFYSSSFQATGGAIRRRDATHRLLMVELAIRLFEQQQGRMPEGLSELIPEFLSAIPVDPYSGQPIVFRSTDSGPKVYCVGVDGQDDGGQIGDITDVLSVGYDFDLETVIRTKNIAPPTNTAPPADPFSGSGGMGGGGFF